MPTIMKKWRWGTEPVIGCDAVPCPRDDLLGPCLIFRGGKCKGYGRVWSGGKNRLVHQYVWECVNGKVPSGMVLDHQCRNRACCNIDHIRVVTRKINSTENVVGIGWQLGKAKTHCPSGHEYSPSNTYTDKRGCRSCRECTRARSLRTYHDKIWHRLAACATVG